MNDCGTENILRELTKRADRKELDEAKRELEQVKMKNAHLNAQVSSMAQELSRKKRGDPQIPRRAGSGLLADPGADQATGRGRHQGPIV